MKTNSTALTTSYSPMLAEVNYRNFDVSARYLNRFLTIRVSELRSDDTRTFDAYLYVLDASIPQNNRTPIAFTGEMHFNGNNLVKIQLQGLDGNGDDRPQYCNKSHGTFLVASTLKYLVMDLRLNGIGITRLVIEGVLSNITDSRIESHQRRVAFWAKFGLQATHPEDKNTPVIGAFNESLISALTPLTQGSYEKGCALGIDNTNPSDFECIEQYASSLDRTFDWTSYNALQKELEAKTTKYYQQCCIGCAGVLFALLLMLGFTITNIVVLAICAAIGYSAFWSSMPLPKALKLLMQEIEVQNQILGKEQSALKRTILDIENGHNGLIKRLLRFQGLERELELIEKHFGHHIVLTSELTREGVIAYLEAFKKVEQSLFSHSYEKLETTATEQLV